MTGWAPQSVAECSRISRAFEVCTCGSEHSAEACVPEGPFKSSCSWCLSELSLQGRCSLPASYWGQPERAAFGEIGWRRRNVFFVPFLPAFCWPFPASLLHSTGAPHRPCIPRCLLCLCTLDAWRRPWSLSHLSKIIALVWDLTLFLIKTDIAILQGRKLIW